MAHGRRQESKCTALAVGTPSMDFDVEGTGRSAGSENRLETMETKTPGSGMPISGCPCMRMGSGCMQVETAATAPGRHRRNAYSFPGTSPATRDFGSNAQTSRWARKTNPRPKIRSTGDSALGERLSRPHFCPRRTKRSRKREAAWRSSSHSLGARWSRDTGTRTGLGHGPPATLCPRGTEPIGNMPSAVAPGARKRPRSPARSAGPAPPPKLPSVWKESGGQASRWLPDNLTGTRRPRLLRPRAQKPARRGELGKSTEDRWYLRY